MRAFIPEGTTIENKRGGVGLATGEQRPCVCKGSTRCEMSGIQVAIRWGNGRITWHCTRKMDIGATGAKIVS